MCSAASTEFRSELDEETLADIRVAISQGHLLGNNRFTAAVCAAAGVRRTQARRGRPEGKAGVRHEREDQTDFGF